jgi:hypothetical protein
MVETVRIVYPNAGVTQLTSLINSAVDLFVEKTFILDGSDTLTFSTLTTNVGEDITTNEGDVLGYEEDASYSFVLPSTCLRLYRVESLYGTGEEMPTPLGYRVEHGTIYFYDFYSRLQATVGGQGGIVIVLHFYRKATPMSAITHSVDLPAFREEVLANVFERYAAIEKDYNGAQYWRTKFHEVVLDGKRYANDRGTSGDISITPYYF